MLVCVVPLAPGPSIAKQTKVLEENVIGKYTNLFGASNPHCLISNNKPSKNIWCFFKFKCNIINICIGNA